MIIEVFIESHCKSVERFALQYGCDKEQAIRITMDAFKSTNQETIEVNNHSFIHLFKQVTKLLEQVDLTNEETENFPFEEDANLHAQILKLTHMKRIPFILSTFQKIDIDDIALIMETTPSDVKREIHLAKDFLMLAAEEITEERLEKRLQLLGKTYDRLPLYFDQHQFYATEKAENPLEESIQTKGNRKGIMIAAVVGFLLISLLATTIFMGDEWALTSDERYVEKLNKDFEKEKNKRMETLGITEDVFNKITFIEVENIRFKNMIEDFEKRIGKEQKVNREFGDETFHKIIESMKLPSELADDLFKSPLNDDVDKSMTFLKNYFAKMAVVSDALFQEILPELENFTEYTGFFDFDGELFLSKEKEFNESTQRAIYGLRSQDLPVLPQYFDLGLAVDPTRTLHLEKMRKSLHESAGGYITLQEKEPFVVDDKLVYSLEDTIDFIKEMENTMKADTTADPDYSFSLQGMIGFFLEMILSDRTIEPLRDTDGKISKVHREAWKKLASFDMDSGVERLMTKIVDEMEVSDWEQSEFLTALGQEEHRIYEAYYMAIEGNLESFQLEYEIPVYSMYEGRVVDPKSMWAETKALYEAFAVDYNESLLVNTHPLQILTLFYYANEIEDSMMMWLLSDEASRGETPAEYINDWKKEESLLLKADTEISFDPALITENGDKPHVPLAISRSGGGSNYVWVTYGQDDIWRIEGFISAN